MASFKKFLLWPVGLFGSLFMFVGFVLLFFGLILGNMTSNIESFDGFVLGSVEKFVNENREEVREFVGGQIVDANGPMDFRKSDIIAFCGMMKSSPETLLVQTDGNSKQMDALDLQDVLKENVCSLDLNSKSEQEIRDAIYDSMIDMSLENGANIMGETTGVKEQLYSVRETYDSYKHFIFLGVAIIWALGIFMVFAGYSFNLKKTVYSIALHNAISFFFVGLSFYIIKTMKPDTITGLIDSLSSKMPELAVEVPPIVTKFAAAVLLDWLRMATNPLMITSFLIAIPFIAIVVIMIILRKKSEKSKKEGVKDEVA